MLIQDGSSTIPPGHSFTTRSATAMHPHFQNLLFFMRTCNFVFSFLRPQKKKKKEEEESVDKEKGMLGKKKRTSTVYREKPGSRPYKLYLLQRK